MTASDSSRENESQIIIIENHHPPSDVVNKFEMIVFTGNPNEENFGLL